jgi:phage-related protein
MAYKIKLYADAQGNQPIKEYLRELGRNTDKDSRIQLSKIHEYIETLKEHGTRAGEPFVKHIDGDIWELRPLRDRLFFFAWQGDKFVLLHHYIKKTQKAPTREIAQAKRNLKDFIERSKNDEE